MRENTGTEMCLFSAYFLIDLSYFHTKFEIELNLKYTLEFKPKHYIAQNNLKCRMYRGKFDALYGNIIPTRIINALNVQFKNEWLSSLAILVS